MNQQSRETLAKGRPLRPALYKDAPEPTANALMQFVLDTEAYAQACEERIRQLEKLVQLAEATTNRRSSSKDFTRLCEALQEARQEPSAPASAKGATP